jgi:hypothetical protein
MTETPMPPAATTTGKKKGLSPLAWIGIGCLALILIAGVLFFSCSVFVAKKAKDFAGDLQKNPVKTLAETAVRVNPNLSIVSTDDDAGTMTIFDKTTGQELTLGYKDIADGKFSMQTEKGQVSFDTSQVTTGGVVKVQGNDGSEARIGITGEALPDWIPIYPGSKPSVTFVNESEGRTDGAFNFSTDTGAQEVLDFYRVALEGAGFEVDSTTFPTGGSVTAKKTGFELGLFVTGWGQGLGVQGTYVETE